MEEKAKTLLIGKDGTRKVGEGDLVLAFQSNRDNRGGLNTNLDWLFDNSTTDEEVRASFGSLLSSIEEVFGEKMVTEAIIHYAEEKGHLVKTPQGSGFHFKSQGLKFKNWRE